MQETSTSSRRALLEDKKIDRKDLRPRSKDGEVLISFSLRDSEILKEE